MATIVITSKNDSLFTKTVGVISADYVRNYHAQESTGGFVRAELISDENSDLFNPIHFSELEIDGVVPADANEAVSLLNAVIYAGAGGGAGGGGEVAVLEEIRDRLNTDCADPIKVEVCNPADNTAIEGLLQDILDSNEAQEALITASNTLLTGIRTDLAVLHADNLITNQELADINTELDNIEATLNSIEAADATFHVDILAALNALEVLLGNISIDTTNISAGVTTLINQTDQVETLLTTIATGGAANIAKLEELRLLLVSIDGSTDGLETQLSSLLSEFDQSQLLLTDIRDRLNTDCTAPLNVRICSQIVQREMCATINGEGAIVLGIFDLSSTGTTFIRVEDHMGNELTEGTGIGQYCLCDSGNVSSYTIEVTNATNQNIWIIETNGNDYVVDWGDGTIETFTSGASNTHAYATAYTGDIIVSGTACSLSLRLLSMAGNSYTSFDIATLPNELVIFTNTGVNTSFGNIADLKDGLAQYVNEGQNTTLGNILDLPSTITTYVNNGQNTVTGNIADMPTGMFTFRSQGQSTTFGDIADLPIGIKNYFNEGQNTTTGDMADLPAGMLIYSSSGQNTTFGDIADLPSTLKNYVNRGLNMVSGDLASLPPDIVIYRVSGNNTVSNYTSPRVWAASMNYFESQPISGGLSTVEMDNLLIDLSNTTWVGSKTIRLLGANSPRSTASDAAVASLTAAGVTVITN